MVALFILASLYFVPYGCERIAGNASMVLYGRIIDQLGNPVQGASLEFVASRSSRWMVPIMWADNDFAWPVRTVSAMNGTFELDPGRGRVLLARSAAKEGYASALIGRGSFVYTKLPPNPLYRADPANPAIFMMWNQKFAHVVTREISLEPPMDGALRGIQYLTGDITANGNQTTQVNIEIIGPAGEAQSIRVTGDIGTELRESVGPFIGKAPDGDYVAKLIFPIKQSGPESPTRRFYTYNRFSTVYARVEMKTMLSPESGTVRVTIRYTANFDHTRDLISGPVIPPAR